LRPFYFFNSSFILLKFGSNYIIGADSFIMLGAVIGDSTVVGVNDIVLEDQVLGKGKMYEGVPAKEIKKMF